MANTETGQLKSYNKYRYASSINLVPILDKSSPFLCTVYLFDGETAARNNKTTIEIGNMPKSTGFFIDSSFNEIDITHNFEASKGGFMTEVKKKILDTLQSFFKDDPAMAAAGISAFKEVPGIMSFVNLFIDADKLTDFSASFNRILANSQLRYPEEHIKVYNGSNIEVPNIVVKKYYISFDASNDPYEDLFKDIITLKLLPTLFSPSSFEVVKNLLSGLDNALGGKDIKFDVLETDIYQPFIEVASFLYYYTNMAAQAYLVADNTGHDSFDIKGSGHLVTLGLVSDTAYNYYEEFQYFWKYDKESCKDKRNGNPVYNGPTVGYCLVGLSLSPLTNENIKKHVFHAKVPDAEQCFNDPDCLVKSGILIAWFFGGLFAKDEKGIPLYIDYAAHKGVSFYFPQISADALLNITNPLPSGDPRVSMDDSSSWAARYGAKCFTDIINVFTNIKKLREKIGTFFGLDHSSIPYCLFADHMSTFNQARDRFNAITDFLFNNANQLWKGPCNRENSVMAVLYDQAQTTAAALDNLFSDYDAEADCHVPILVAITLNQDFSFRFATVEEHKQKLHKVLFGPAYQLMAYGAFLSYHTTLFKIAGLVQKFYTYAISVGTRTPKILEAMGSYSSSSIGAREPIGIMPTFLLSPVKELMNEYYPGIDQSKFEFVMLVIGTVIGGYAQPYDQIKWHEALSYYVQNPKNIKTAEYHIMPSYLKSDSIFGGLFARVSREDIGYVEEKIDYNTFVAKTFDFLGQTDLGYKIIEKVKNDINSFLGHFIIINYLKGTMIFLGLLFYYSARNLSLYQAREAYEKIKKQREDLSKLEESYAVLFQAIMNDRNELTQFYHLLLNASVLYSLFGSVKNSSHANIIDNVPWSKAKIGTENDYNSDNHKMWFKLDDPEIKDKIMPYVEKMKKEKGFNRLINFAEDQNLGISRFLFFFRPVDNNSIGKSCAYAYYLYDCLYYFNIFNIFGKDRKSKEKIVLMNTRMETIARRSMVRTEDISRMKKSSISSLKAGDKCFSETMFTYMANLYKEIMDTYLQSGASTTSAEDVETNEGKAGGKTEGVKVKEEQGDLFLAKILNMFNVLLTLPPGNYHYVPYFKYLFKALLSGSTYVTINNVQYFISYYLIVLHNISALSRSGANTKIDGAKTSSKGDSRVLAYLIPTNVQIKTSEVYTYPFDFNNELVNKNKARPLYTILTIQFKPIEDLLYIYATHFTLDEIRRALALDAPDFGGVGRMKSDPCDTGKLETQEVNNPCEEPKPSNS
ncbi:MAG: hypothetical protein QXS19_08170 [Candidatus Methanomethylicia archaeon]